MRYLILFLLISSASAEEYKPMHYEIAWQVMHAVDVMQTLKIKETPGLEESAIHKIIQRQPDDDNVYAWGVASAIGHYYLFKWLDNNTKYGQTFRKIEIGFKFGAISKNHQMGIRIKF